MKIALLADIHANLAALEAVVADIDAWRPDLVLVAGDIVNRGPQPVECVAFVAARVADGGWRAIQGNHEEYVLSHLESGWPRSGPAFEIRRHAWWTFEKLDRHLDFLRRLTDRLDVAVPADQLLRVVHASMISSRHGIYPEFDDDKLRERIAYPPPLFSADVFAAGHTHRPLVRQVDRTLVLNVGAVGLPFDGDWRACYVRLTWRGGVWSAALRRLPYDRALTARLFQESGYLEEGGDLVRIVLTELELARSLTYAWADAHQQAVLDGEISLSASVDEYLSAVVNQP